MPSITKDSIVLVISGGGSKGIYACGILKAIEELGLKSQIKSIYGVSAGALIGAYRLSGWDAKSIYKNFLNSGLFSIKNISLPPTQGLLNPHVLEKILKKDLKKNFEQLDLPLYIGATDLYKGKFTLFNSGILQIPVIASMAVPGLFPPVQYEDMMLVDGGVTNNFPIDIARAQNPCSKIVGILLSKFKKDQKIGNVLDTLQVSYEILLRAHLNPSLNQADILFYRDLKIGMVENNEKKLNKIFELGYKDSLSTFKS